MSKVNKVQGFSSGTDVIEQYPDLFKERLGMFKGPKVKIYVNEHAEPSFYKARPVPFSYRELVDKEIDKLVLERVVEPMKFSDWAAPIVPVMKPNGTIRLCGNYAVTVNKAAKKDCYPIPHVEELYNKLSHGVIYSKLDLSSAYTQLVLEEESRKYTTINTTKGLFQYTRLPFGISAAPGIFQRTTCMDNLLQDIPMCCVYLDDIVISGKSVDEHNKNLKLVLDRLQAPRLKLKKTKCYFMQKSIEYLGHKLYNEGIHPSGRKFETVQKASRPTNIGELRSFLGIMNYYYKFLKNVSTTLAPLYNLLCDGVKWHWGPEQEQAFIKSKELLKSTKLLVHYNPELPLIVSCDASPA